MFYIGQVDQLECMVAVTYNLYDAKTRLSELVDRAAAGEEIVIAKNGRPLARLGPVPAEKPNRVPGGCPRPYPPWGGGGGGGPWCGSLTTSTNRSPPTSSATSKVPRTTAAPRETAARHSRFFVVARRA